MAATCVEKMIGRRSNLRNGERLYVIKGAALESDALTALLATAPGTVNGLVRIDQNCEVEEIRSDSAGDSSPAGDGIWFGIAKYELYTGGEYQPATSFHISFDISGQQTHITQARAHVASYPSATARNFNGAIGVNSDGSIDGCDIIVPQLTFTINYTFNESDVNDAYIATLMSVVGAVNTDTFHNFVAGTLLLTRVSGQQRDDKKWDVSFGFAVSPNETSLTVGSITGIAKKGWEYLWVYYEEQKVTVGGVDFVHKVPAAAYVEEVYRKTAYSALGI